MIEQDLVPLTAFARECILSERTLRRYLDQAEELGMSDVFYRPHPRGRIFVHRPSWERWIAERKVCRPTQRNPRTSSASSSGE